MFRTLASCAAAFGVAATIPFSANSHEGTHAADHAPIGVMFDHRHKQGEFMLSYRYMRMDMQGSRIGDDDVSPETIATSVPNRFFGAPAQPPTLRVVPTDMTMDMHMFGAMYGLTDRVTLTAMTSYVRNEMDHITFMGPVGPAVLGEFQTTADGIGDTSLGVIYGLDSGKKRGRQINASLALSIPTGSNTQEDQVLAPTGMTPTLRLPYPMQLGSGTFDLKPALTARDRWGRLGAGAQALGVIRLGQDEGYNLGDRAELSIWTSFEPAHWVSFSSRLKATFQGRIDGIDPLIVAPVQTANPDFQGGETVEALIGVNFAGQAGWMQGNRLALEFGLPLHRNLNGPQLETDWTLTVGLQKAF